MGGRDFWRGACRALCSRLHRTTLAFQAGHERHPQLRVRAEPGVAGYPGRDTGGKGLRHHRYQTHRRARAHLAFTLLGKSPRQVAEELDEANIFVWDGNYYALEVTERLGLEESGGMVRVGPVQYNTLEEIEKLGEVLRRIVETKI